MRTYTAGLIILATRIAMQVLILAFCALALVGVAKENDLLAYPSAICAVVGLVLTRKHW